MTTKPLPTAHVDLVSLLRQLSAQVEDGALRGDLEDLLLLDADRLRQIVTIDLAAASVPDSEVPGHLCFGCLQRSVDGTMYYWHPPHGRTGSIRMILLASS